jgi:hypothetical protein
MVSLILFFRINYFNWHGGGGGRQSNASGHGLQVAQVAVVEKLLKYWRSIEILLVQGTAVQGFAGGDRQLRLLSGYR